MTASIENEFLFVSFNQKGAELRNVTNKLTTLEYMWSGDPAVWSKTSPILFPIVGELKDSQYVSGGITYRLSRHGFAREILFSIDEQQKDVISFSLCSNADTLSRYPFHFTLHITYRLLENSLRVEYTVTNTDERIMHFSIGGHPAFRVPLVSETSYEDYLLKFSEKETAFRWPISKEGLIVTEPVPYLEQSDTIHLTRSTFANDALVFKHLQSNKVSLQCSKHEHGVNFNFGEFPFLGIWAAPGGDFVCIEPWCGIADHVDHTGELTTKEGIEMLLPEKSWSRAWQATFY